MELSLKCTTHRAMQCAFTQQAQQAKQIDIIVPDTVPDAAELVDARAWLFLSEPKVVDGSVAVEGEVRTTVLLRPEGEQALRAVQYTVPFSHTLYADGAKMGDLALVSGEVAFCEGRLINSRKVGVKLMMELDVIGLRGGGIQVCETFDAKEEIQMKMSTKTVEAACDAARRYGAVSEELEIARGKPDIRRPLFAQAHVCAVEHRFVGGKVMIKGMLMVELLYQAPDETTETMVWEVPFSQLLDLNGCCEEGQAAVRCALSSLNYEVQTDEQGANRVLALQGTVEVCCVAFCPMEVHVLSDAFALNGALTLERCNKELYTLIRMKPMEFEVRTTMCDREGRPIDRVIWIGYQYTGPDCEQEGEQSALMVRGMLHMLCMMAGEAGEQMLHKEFTAALPADSGCSCGFVVRNPSCDAVHYHLNMAGEAEVRLGLNCQQVEAQNLPIEVVCQAQFMPEEVSGSGLRVVYPARDETLWDIAKQYRVSVESLRAANELKNEECPSMLVVER